jgi:hypothetical protein
VTLLRKTGNTASLPELQPTDLAGNPIARERAWSGLLSQFRRTTRADPAAASAQVETLVQFAVRGATLQRSLVEWVQRMDTIGKGAHARRYLQLLVDDLKLDSDIATAVRAAAEH